MLEFFEVLLRNGMAIFAARLSILSQCNTVTTAPRAVRTHNVVAGMTSRVAQGHNVAR